MHMTYSNRLVWPQHWHTRCADGLLLLPIYSVAYLYAPAVVNSEVRSTVRCLQRVSARQKKNRTRAHCHALPRIAEYVTSPAECARIRRGFKAVLFATAPRTRLCAQSTQTRETSRAAQLTTHLAALAGLSPLTWPHWQVDEVVLLGCTTKRDQVVLVLHCHDLQPRLMC